MFEKGIMGGVFFYQIVNNYLTDSKIGNGVDNITVDTAKNYTAMEHHWDEAFGYFGAPTDFSNNYQGTSSPQYWAKYCNSADAVINTNDLMMFAYRQGRAAIIANQHDVKLISADAVNEHFGEIIAATAIHYANSAKATTNDGDRLHVLTGCYAFTRALRYAHQDNREMTPAEVDALLSSTFDGNLWSVTTIGLNNLIDELSIAYGLESVKDIL